MTLAQQQNKNDDNPMSGPGDDQRSTIEMRETNTFDLPKLTDLPAYCASRFTSIFPTRKEMADLNIKEVINPFHSIGELNRRQWNFFLVGLAGWTMDSFDFFTVSMNVKAIADDLGKSVKDITWGITLVLMLRSVGAVIFGLWGDRYGRKWPFIANMLLLVVLQIGCGFVTTYEQFLGVRALFGIGMGGMYGNCAACALDDCPAKARGLVSGLFQEGYALGYLFVVIFQRAITDTTPKGWRSLFWFSAGLGIVIVIWRFTMPETDAFIAQRRLQKEEAEQKDLKFFEFGEHTKKGIKQYWLIFIYTILLMAGFNFMSHGSQDLYPTLLSEQYHFGPDKSTVTNVVANLGAIAGGMVFGHCSTFIGRRLAIIMACILGGAMIYPWAFSKGTGINAGAFFLQAGTQGAWGVAPIYLMELSIPEYKSLMIGLSYQLGNLCASASSTIEATIGERFPIDDPSKEAVYDYAKVMSIFMGCVYAYNILMTIAGPETRNRGFGFVHNIEDDNESIEEPVERVKSDFEHVETK